MESEPRHQKPVRRGWQWFYQCRMAEPYADDPRAFDESFGISCGTDASEERLASPTKHGSSSRKGVWMISRRSFLGRASAAATYAAMSSHTNVSYAEPLGLPLGIQLYSVRQQLAQDYEGTLAQVGSV